MPELTEEVAGSTSLEAVRDKHSLLAELRAIAAVVEEAEERRDAAYATMTETVVLLYSTGDFTQEELAGVIGVTKQRVSQMISAATRPAAEDTEN